MLTVSNDQPHIRLELLSQPQYLAPVRALIHALAHRYGFLENDSGQIALAVDEALCNVMNHGYEKKPDGLITISVQPIEEPPRGIQIIIEDRGKQVEPAEIQSRDLDHVRPGGLGVHIMRQVMDVVQFNQRPGGGMQLVLEKEHEYSYKPTETPERTDHE